jgi:hypothetical protein
MMAAVEAGTWGLIGGFAVEGLQFNAVIRQTGRWPWRLEGQPPPLPYVISALIRLAVGAGVAAAAGAGGLVVGAFSALAVGVAAPLVVEQLGKQVPFPMSGGRPHDPPTRASADIPGKRNEMAPDSGITDDKVLESTLSPPGSPPERGNVKEGGLQ